MARQRFPKRQSKYGNIKREVDGITFDSIKEANRYAELKMLEKAGYISEVKLQVPFVLQEGFRDRFGKRWQPIKYIADFNCVGFNSAEVRRCDEKDCPLHPYRLTSSGGKGKKADAIRQYCLECCNGSTYERSLCPAKTCPLHKYRNVSASRAAGFGQKTHDSTASDD